MNAANLKELLELGNNMCRSTFLFTPTDVR